MAMIKRDRRTGVMLMRYAVAGLGSLASFAPRTSHEVHVKGIDANRSDREALGGDWTKVGLDLQKAIEIEREKASAA